ncbi:uncharacterized protein LAJ45_10562 [Morchella importuna]|uniref:uncharacterized protein n=1 Tax=Morchella importuna TaxID=1174673 RepID=UPI001E8EE0E2|nr:uncharacterized protein LAJ45_10562 [Morchella importuna]KAH8145440.1 hypothetical protein LAJ45_10562 [Morchella importuna]
MDRSSERHQNQYHNDVDDIEDFEGESQPISTSQYPPAIKVPLRSEQQPMSAARSTPKPQQGIPQSSGKRKGFYDGIDPDLFALADGQPFDLPGASRRATEDDITSTKTGKVPESVQTQEHFEFPTPTPQTQSKKSRGFAIDPDLLAAASPVKEKPERAVIGWKPSISQAIAAPDSSSRVLWPTESFRATPQQMTKHNPVPSDDIVPETSPPRFTTPPRQNLPLLNDDSQISTTDSIEDLVSPRKSENLRPKTEDFDIIHSDIDITSSPPLSPLSSHSFKPKHKDDDGSVSGDSLPDDLMTLDNPVTPLPIHKRLLKELTQQSPATPTPQTPRPGYFNIHDLQKSVIIPKTESSRAPDPQHRRYSPGGLADTVLGWREELHSTSLFKQRVQPIGVDYIITVIEVVQDGDMIIVKGHGVEGVVRAIISGPVRLGLQITVGQVVRYGRPWVLVNLLGEEWKSLMGKVEVIERDVDVDMGE